MSRNSNKQCKGFLALVKQILVATEDISASIQQEASSLQMIHGTMGDWFILSIKH